MQGRRDQRGGHKYSGQFDRCHPEGAIDAADFSDDALKGDNDRHVYEIEGEGRLSSEDKRRSSERPLAIRPRK